MSNFSPYDEDAAFNTHHYVLCVCGRCHVEDYINCGIGADEREIVACVASEGWQNYTSYSGSISLLCPECIKDVKELERHNKILRAKLNLIKGEDHECR